MAYLVLSSFPDPVVAEQLAEQLIKKALAACVNLLPALTSIYRWENKIERAQETLLLIKTSVEAYPALEKFLRAQHPYQVPEIIALPLAAGAADYLQWVARSCHPQLGESSDVAA